MDVFGVSDRSASEQPSLSSFESDGDSDDRSDSSVWLSIDVLQVNPEERCCLLGGDEVVHATAGMGYRPGETR
jgi:hypothetical protein